jgi:hypothetical protein
MAATGLYPIDFKENMSRLILGPNLPFIVALRPKIKTDNRFCPNISLTISPIIFIQGNYGTSDLSDAKPL